MEPSHATRVIIVIVACASEVLPVRGKQWRCWRVEHNHGEIGLQEREPVFLTLGHNSCANRDWDGRSGSVSVEASESPANDGGFVREPGARRPRDG